MKFHGLYLYDFQGNVLNSISVINQNKKNLYSLCLKFHNFIQNSKCIETKYPQWQYTSPCLASSITIQMGWASEQIPTRWMMWGWSNCCMITAIRAGCQCSHDYITEQPNIWPQWIKSGVWGQIESVIMYISCLF